MEPEKMLQLYLYLRRRQKRRQLQVILMQNIFSTKPPRSIWMKTRSQSFWYETIKNHWVDEDWVKNMRMSKDAFYFLCNELSPYISKEDTRFRTCIQVDVRLGITLYFLSGAIDLRTMGNLFGLGRSTVCTIIHTVCNEIVSNSLKKYVFLPKRNEVKMIMEEFEKASGFPQAVAAVDGCHIRIKAPNKNPEDYINRKEYHSIVLQGLVDSKYLFRDIFAGWTGRSHDARIFKSSLLYKECQERSFLPLNLAREIGDIEVGSLVLGDSAYSLENWLMKPYSDRGNLDRDEVRFNFSLSKIRVVVENAFGRLKGRFQCLSKRLDTTVEHTVNIVSTCCILHNFCVLSNQRFLEEWEQTDVDLVINPNNARCVEAENEAQAIRNAIRDHVNNQ